MVAVTMTSTSPPHSVHPLPNGFVSADSMTVAEIKDQAKNNVHRIKGASVLSLLKTAKEQSTTASLQENAGDLKSALRAYIMASSLLRLIYDSTEYKAEFADPKKRGVFWREFKDFNAHFTSIIVPRTQKLEAKLRDLEHNRQSNEGGNTNQVVDSADGTDRKLGGSIADRLRSLQDAGLTVGVPKRFSRDLSIASNAASISTRTASRPPPLAPRPSASSYSGLASPPPTHPSYPASPPPPASTLSSPHAFVSTSSLGPPSPSSSRGSSPELPKSPRSFDFATAASSSKHVLYATRTESEFAHAFPSIDELNEQLDAFPSVPSDRPSSPTFPSVPATKPGRASLPPPPSSARDLFNSGSGASSILSGRESAASESPPPSDAAAQRPPAPAQPFPSVHSMPHQRPASTPIPPTQTEISQPTSPAERSPAQRPYHELPSPPSGTNTTNPNYVTTTPVRMNGKPDLPVTSTIHPHLLRDYRARGLRILLLDIRTRAEFDAERIKGDEVVCLEPSILTREHTTSSKIELALVVSPPSERALFGNRAKFDLVVMYDAESMTPGPPGSPISSLVRAIFEREYVNSLKRPPVLLVGGLEAWRREVGDTGIVRGPVTSPGREAVDIPAVEIRSQDDSLVAETPPDPHERWVPGAHPGIGPRDLVQPTQKERPRAWYVTQTPLPSSPQPQSVNGVPADGAEHARRLARKPAMARPPSSGHVSTLFHRTLSDNVTGQNMPQSSLGMVQTQPPASIQYPSVMPSGSGVSPYPSASLMSSSSSSSLASTSSFRASSNDSIVSPPPLASINPSPLSRRRSDYVDQAHQVYSGVTRASIDYPDLSTPHVLRPPPAAASSALERQDQRSRSAHGLSILYGAPAAPMIKSDYPVVFWGDVQIGTSGLKNLGNTCYMNSTIQCLSATVPFARFFTDGRWKNAVNMLNPLGSKGNIAKAFASLLHEMWHGDLPYIAPYSFRKSVCIFAPQFGGSDQHDSQEFLSFLLDGLHEDLNRVLQKPRIETASDRETQLETLPQQIASEQEWNIYRMRNDSLIVDYFQGQFRNRLQCLTCQKTSTTYNPFMYLSLPLPSGRTTKTTLYQCLEAFVKEEVLEKSEAWNCPKCKTLRKATKQLSLSRLPPVLMISLKRFSFKGPFTDKLETFVDFPLKGLDLTNYLPMPLPPGVDSGGVNRVTSSDDPRAQLPPYKYDLYAVTNHFGSLSSGHYTAFISSRGGWLYCEDSRVTNANSREIVARPAYVLYYKRVKL